MKKKMLENSTTYNGLTAEEMEESLLLMKQERMSEYEIYDEDINLEIAIQKKKEIMSINIGEQDEIQ